MIFEEVAGHLAFIHDMPRWIALLTLLCLLVFAPLVAQGSAREHAPDRKELKRAETILSKLRRLEEAAASVEPEAFTKAARKLYPDLYASVSGLRDGDLKTDLSTAVALYESALRAKDIGDVAPDCSRELRETYFRLCREASSGGRAMLLRAKALLHARRAGDALAYARGDRSADVLDSVSLLRAERTTDRALAAEALHVLEEIIVEVGGDTSNVEGSARDALAGRHSERLDENLAGRLEQVDRILASLPRDHTRQLLRDAAQAFRDALFWRLKAQPARALVVNANSFGAPGVLPRFDLRADDAERAALADQRAALKLIRKAKEELGTRN
ncbi:MAG: hypothetical protein QOE46_1737 [Acidobacteriota bacterium]|jgi:hypothetical protein|nr:hypothetical protein [Acidobacteriota bacterium]